jgi:chaperonin cofactor prefoldin
MQKKGMIMTNIKIRISGIVIYLLISGCVLPALALDSFTQADRERLVRMEATQTVFMQQVDKRLEQVDKRIEQVDKRFEQVDKRFEELRTDMNARFEQVDKRFEQVDKRFEQVDKRFEQIDKRFEEQRSDTNTRFEELRSDMNARFEQTANMFYVLSVIFTTLFAAVFSFAWWDRRSVLITARKAAKEVVEEKTQDIEKITLTVEQVVKVLRRHADKTPAFKAIMQWANLL